jgi:dihydroorotate dehydrogenase (NAD+) catalytic subunit
VTRSSGSGSDAVTDLAVRLGPLELPSPIVAASGTFGHGDEVARLCDPSSLGAVTAKSQAPFPWAGNPPPRLHPAAAGMVNAVGLQGRGVAAWAHDDLPGLRARGARVIASLWGHTPDDYRAGMEALAPVAGDLVAVELNLSCPNTAGGGDMFATSAPATGAVVAGVAAVGSPLPLFAKLTPGVADLPAIAAAAADAGATGVTLGNTVRALLVDADARRPVLGSPGGGLSGPAIKPIALRAVHDVHRAHPDLPVIGTGGVSTGTDAVEMLLAGASAVGVGTATFAEPRATLRILGELAAWCDHHGVRAVRSLTGAMRVHDRPDDELEGASMAGPR